MVLVNFYLQVFTRTGWDPDQVGDDVLIFDSFVIPALFLSF